MEEENKTFIYLFWGGVIIFILWLLFSNSNKEPQYIREEFKNGNTIETKVDDSITRDNWVCTGDCSGHDAGYEWAGEQGITDPSDCGGNSESFIEGCEAYANENN